MAFPWGFMLITSQDLYLQSVINYKNEVVNIKKQTFPFRPPFSVRLETSEKYVFGGLQKLTVINIEKRCWIKCLTINL